ncbi:MAG: C_GCAxxG_C_C family protein, partial [Candidatus Aminicenantes bacterium]|nr:C_GCAxxG_C_C family protein [Candidatus Aminicenantes bacterium]
MNPADEAVKNFEEGWNCSQAVLAAFSEALGLEKEKAFKIAQAFGGGMARVGFTCGAVTGALMVIGLKHGRARSGDEAAKEKTYALARECMRRFKSRHGSLVCRELIGVD